MFPKNLPGSPVFVKWSVGSVILVTLTAAVAWFSPAFAPEIPLTQQPVLLPVVLLILAGSIYFFLCRQAGKASGKRVLAGMLIAGAVMRGVMLFTTPILEVDFNRYLWDGAVTASGENPYAFSPAAVLSGEAGPAALQELARHPHATIERINHPQVRSIYPPITQAAFALAYLIGPWQLWPWRLILLVADVVTLLLLLVLLRGMDLPPLWVAIFWMNPLYVKEMFNSAHMDALIFPFLLAALLLLIRRRYLWAVACLALSVGVKLWPVLLLPLFLREIGLHWRRQIAAVALFFGIVTLLLAPMLLTGWDQQAGLAAYAQNWELNDAAFRVIYGFSEWLVVWFGYHPGHAQTVSRRLLAVLLAGWVLVVFLRNAPTPRDLADHCLFVTAGLFLVSPTQFPWYGMWLTPLLAFSPRRPLLLLTVLLPLYYLWYYFEPRGKVDIFSHMIVWMEFAPVWLWLLYDWARHGLQMLQNHAETGGR